MIDLTGKRRRFICFRDFAMDTNQNLDIAHKILKLSGKTDGADLNDIPDTPKRYFYSNGSEKRQNGTWGFD